MKLKPIPKFKNEQEEQEFWSEHDVTKYMQVVKAGGSYFPNLKAQTETISLRLPQELLNTIKAQANRQDIPYQSLMKSKLFELFMVKRKRHYGRSEQPTAAPGQSTKTV
jgi:predicted DNA binding CopG/RHH family protein